MITNVKIVLILNKFFQIGLRVEQSDKTTPAGAVLIREVLKLHQEKHVELNKHICISKNKQRQNNFYLAQLKLRSKLITN